MDPDITQTLPQILHLHVLWLADTSSGERACFQDADLRDADLQGADLRWANFQEANLEGADLRHANLWHADFRGANLEGADLRGANMRRVDLYEADLQGADLRGADLDFSALPLWCGSFDLHIDRRQAAQMAYHFCRLVIDGDDSGDCQAAQQALKDLANQFHLVDNGQFGLYMSAGLCPRIE